MYQLTQCELGLLAKTFSQMSSELHKLYRSLEASVEEKRTIPHEAHRRPRCYTSVQALNTSQIDVHCFAIFCKLSVNMTPPRIWRLTVGDNLGGLAKATQPRPADANASDDAGHGLYELHWQSPNVNAFYAAAEQLPHDAGVAVVL